jgi:hypothetical protein
MKSGLSFRKNETPSNLKRASVYKICTKSSILFLDRRKYICSIAQRYNLQIDISKTSLSKKNWDEKDDKCTWEFVDGGLLADTDTRAHLFVEHATRLLASLSQRAPTRRSHARSLFSLLPNGHRPRRSPSPGHSLRGPRAIPAVLRRRGAVPGPPGAAQASGGGRLPPSGISRVPGGGSLRRRRRRAEGAHGASVQCPHHWLHQRWCVLFFFCLMLGLHGIIEL